jgi:hypothetical protein
MSASTGSFFLPTESRHSTHIRHKRCKYDCAPLIIKEDALKKYVPSRLYLVFHQTNFRYDPDVALTHVKNACLYLLSNRNGIYYLCITSNAGMFICKYVRACASLYIYICVCVVCACVFVCLLYLDSQRY